MNLNVQCGGLCFVLLAGLGLLWWFGWPQWARSAPMMATDMSPDGVWETPYYLRYNTPVAGTTTAIAPTSAGDSWSLATAVPSQWVAR